MRESAFYSVSTGSEPLSGAFSLLRTSALSVDWVERVCASRTRVLELSAFFVLLFSTTSRQHSSEVGVVSVDVVRVTHNLATPPGQDRRIGIHLLLLSVKL